MAFRQKTLERPISERRFSNNRHGAVFKPEFSLEQLADDKDAAIVERKARNSSPSIRSRRLPRHSALDVIAPRPQNKTIDEIVAQLSPSLVDTRLMIPYFIANNSTTVVSELGSPTESDGPTFDTDSVAPTDSTLSFSRPFSMKDRRLRKKQVRTAPKKREPEETERLANAVCCHASFIFLFLTHIAVERDKKPSL
jgi:hypothetical protein